MDEPEGKVASPETDPARAMLGDLAEVARLALPVSIALSVVLSAVSLFTAESGKGPRCAGSVIAGAVGFGECVGLAIFCGFILWAVGVSGREERLKKFFEATESASGDIDPFFGRTVAYATLGMFVAILAITVGFLAIKALYPILALCLPTVSAGTGAP